MQKMSKTTQNKILGYIDSVTTHTADGLSPNDAIIKVARDEDIEPGHVQLIVHAYNNAKMNQQRTNSHTLFDKVANYTIADPKVIFGELYPATTKEASHSDDTVSSDYSALPKKLPSQSWTEAMEKIASETPQRIHPKYQRDPIYNVKRASSLLQEIGQVRDQKRQELTHCELTATTAYDALRDYFKTAGHQVSFSEAKTNSELIFGKGSSVLFNTLESVLPKFAKEGVDKSIPVDINQAPYKLVKMCVDSAKKYAAAKSDFLAFDKESSTAKSSLLGHFQPRPPTRISGSLVSRNSTKQADEGVDAAKLLTGGALGEALRSNVGRALGSDTPKETLQSKAFMSVTDPEQDLKLRGLRAQHMLSDFMNNDEYISGEDPSKVSQMYNEIVKLSPRSADQPLLMRSLLRRYLAQGQVDPHDVDQLSGIETKMRQSQESPREAALPKLPGDLVQQAPRR